MTNTNGRKRTGHTLGEVKDETRKLPRLHPRLQQRLVAWILRYGRSDIWNYAFTGVVLMIFSLRIRNFTGGINQLVDHSAIPATRVFHSRNVYYDLSRIVRPTKRDMGRDGIWYFDGQFFSLTRPRYNTSEDNI